MGVRAVGPYRPRFRAAADFLGCFTLGNGEKTCCCCLVDGNAGVDGEEDMCGLDDEEAEESEGVEGEEVL